MAYTKEKVEAGIAEKEKHESLKRWAQEGRRISKFAQLRAMAADLEQQNAALKADNATLLGCVTAENEQNASLIEALPNELAYIYWSAYHAGHHDTVEGQYTDVFPDDKFEYHADAVQELIQGGDMPEIQAALARAESAEGEK